MTPQHLAEPLLSAQIERERESAVDTRIVHRGEQPSEFFE